MTIPIHRVVLKHGANTLYTLDNEMLNWRFKNVLTDGLGNFSFSLPAEKGGSYKYHDVALFDTAELYVGYDSVPANPNFVGKILQIHGAMTEKDGFVRTFKGLDQGEVTARRIRLCKYWDATGASTIATAVATDLGLLGGTIDVDATAETIVTETETYFDVLKRVSDYWVNAGTQVKKDFYVNVDNDLMWQTRPIRTAGVESLTIGDNVRTYSVFRDVKSVRNKIRVFGEFNVDAEMPNDENWTEGNDTDNWTLLSGTMTADSVNVNKGSWSIKCVSTGGGAPYLANLYRTFEPEFPHITSKNGTTINSFRQLKFDLYVSVAPNTESYVKLWAPDSSNYFYRFWDMAGGAWTANTWTLPQDDAHLNAWSKQGSPNYENLTTVQFTGNDDIAQWTLQIDDLRFTEGRFYGTEEDATSQSDYGQRDMVHVADMLKSDSDCEKRGQTLLYQKKDPPTQVTMRLIGNTNVLIGDRIPLTIPAENISADDFDVISVEHSFPPFMTTAVLVDSGNVRRVITGSDWASLFRDLKRRAELSHRAERWSNVG